MPLAIPRRRFVYREQPVITAVNAVATRVTGVRAATQASLHIATPSRFLSFRTSTPLFRDIISLGAD